MSMIRWLPLVCCLSLTTAAQAVEPAAPTERYQAMSQPCRDFENGLRKSPDHIPSANKLFLESSAQCDYRGSDPARWRG